MLVNVSIRTSLLFIVAVLVSLLMLVGVGSMRALSVSNESLSVAQADMLSADALTTGWSALLRARAAFDATDRHFGNGELDASNASLGDGRSLLEAARISWNRFRDMVPEATQSEMDAAVASAYADLLDSVLTPAAQALKSGDMVKYRALVAGPMDAAFAKLDKSLGTVVSARKARASDMFDSAQRHAIFVRGMLTGALALSVLLAGGSVWILREKVTQPLTVVVGVVEHLASGDLTDPIDTGVLSTETGRLSTALRKMQASLIEIVGAINRSAESIDLSAREIASGNLDLSARTEEQAASLEQTAASMTQLTQTVMQNTDNARQADVLATRATGLADAGNEAVRSMIGTIGKISSSSSQISDITGIIEGIAFQTNILALNAAVEAARAGEQGRGFAVVAAEVRSLAQRSATAAREIKDLIGSSVELIQSGAQQAMEVGETVDRVRQAIRQVSDIVSEITAASEEQGRGIEQINLAVTQMDEVTQHNAALVEEAAAAAQSQEQQTAELKHAVSAFRLPEVAVSAPESINMSLQWASPSLKRVLDAALDGTRKRIGA
jgi:methyl-accepting chemotaxis protein I, serine sensor receptor